MSPSEAPAIITGEADEITAIYQVDNITATQVQPDLIIASAQVDSLVIVDEDSNISGNINVPDAVTAVAQVDNITIIEAAPIVLTIID